MFVCRTVSELRFYGCCHPCYSYNVFKESNTESSLHAMTNTSTRAALGSSSPTPCVIPRGEREECEGPLLDGHKCVDEESVNSYITSAPSSVCTPCKSAYSSPSSNKSLSR